MDAEWSEQDLEEVYRQTLEAVDAATHDVSQSFEDATDDAPDETESVLDLTNPEPDEHQDSPADFQPEPLPVSARQVVEAVLFVGGGPITGKQIADLLGGETSHERVDELIESLNARYVEQCRPYEIRLVEGGYQLTLRPEFDRVRHRVFGLGPKEVKLSLDALELLALVAYRQPITKAEIDELGKTSAPTILRQLLRRELISLEREEEGGKSVVYQTTGRFLELFGLKSLDDLPQVEDLMLR